MFCVNFDDCDSTGFDRRYKCNIGSYQFHDIFGAPCFNSYTQRKQACFLSKGPQGVSDRAYNQAWTRFKLTHETFYASSAPTPRTVSQVQILQQSKMTNQSKFGPKTANQKRTKSNHRHRPLPPILITVRTQFSLVSRKVFCVFALCCPRFVFA